MDVLKLDVDAVPVLRGAFVDALAKLDQQLTVAEAELRVPAWAADQVSADATTDFNRHSVDSFDHGASALDQLRAYREVLADAVASLDATAADYAALDEVAGADVTKQGASWAELAERTIDIHASWAELAERTIDIHAATSTAEGAGGAEPAERSGAT